MEITVAESNNKVTGMSRWKAFAIHLSISVCVFLALLMVILTVWYPGILFNIDGGFAGLRIVMGVDIVLGPILTLIVFKAGKPGLKFDLTCIALAQVACMAVGTWIVYSERPVAMILAYDTFYSLAAEDFTLQDKDPNVLASFPGRSPKMLYVELPENDISAEIAAIRSQFIGDPLFLQTENYRSLVDSSAPMSLVFRREAELRSNLGDELLSELPENCRLAKFVSAITSGYVCYDESANNLSNFIPDVTETGVNQ